MQAGAAPSDPRPRVLLGAVLLAWAAFLGTILTHGIFVTNDALSNYGHVWYVSERFWGGHGIPYHMPVLGHGEALAFPYAFLPWMTSALLYPLLGDWAVTLWLVLGFLALFGAILWALPELRTPMAVSLVLLNPVMVEGPLLGQLPYMWAAAMLFVAIGLWRRQRWLPAAIVLGLAQATHAPLLLPIAGVTVALRWLFWEPDRRRLALYYALSLAIALPAVWMVFASPVVGDTSKAVQLANLIGTTGMRAPIVWWPFALMWLLPRVKGYMPYAIAVALIAINIIWVPVRQNDFGWQALTRRPDTSVRPFLSSKTFEPGKTYRILSSRDGKVPMYDVIRAGGNLDSEFFPESIGRRSFADGSEYVRFLNDRRVDYVVIYGLYDRAHRTNEHELLEAMRRTPADGVCTRLVAVGDDGQLYEAPAGLIVGQFGDEGPQYSVYRVQREGC